MVHSEITGAAAAEMIRIKRVQLNEALGKLAKAFKGRSVQRCIVLDEVLVASAEGITFESDRFKTPIAQDIYECLFNIKTLQGIIKAEMRQGILDASDPVYKDLTSDQRDALMRTLW